MREADFQRMWRDYITDSPPMDSEVYELKIVKALKTKSFPFDAVKEHQIAGLLRAISGMFYKISDSPIFPGMKTRYTSAKPYDCHYLKASRGFIVVLVYFPRRPKIVYKIPVQEFVSLKNYYWNTAKRKSIKLEEMDKLPLEHPTVEKIIL